jgi:exopolysaccharide biosynthesis polyprenyl glycosylphosphotransferase
MNSERMTPLVLLLLDLAMTVLVFNVISHFRGVADHLLLGTLVPPMIALVFALYLIEGYRPKTDMISVDYASQHTIAMIAALLATLLYTFAFVTGGYALQSSRGVIALSFVGLFPLTLGYRRMIYQRSLAARGEQSFVFLGDHASCRDFREECLKMGTRQPVVYSVVSEASIAPFDTTDRTYLRLFDEVLADVQAKRLSVEAIILRESNRELAPGISQQLVQLYFKGVPTYTLELFHQIQWQKIPLYRINQTWLFQEGFQIAREPVFERLKRASDILLALLGLVLASPILLVAGLLVWLEDRGPVFFSQTRIGLNRVPFQILKLRTMRVSDGKSGNLYTQVGDARITRIGRLLRASRIDEFPQLWSVLLGHMSLIGPRAEWDRLVADYEREIPCYYFRHLVKPGITGWAQVNYPYGANLADTLRKLEYDLYYIRHFSFRLDASIVLKTIHVMLFGKGR